jgi:hypothetical protein
LKKATIAAKQAIYPKLDKMGGAMTLRYGGLKVLGNVFLFRFKK